MMGEFPKMKEKVNIKTIAQRAGVSVATVSRVINQNGRFSAETEATVKRVMKEMDYHPNTVAKSLREKHSRVIGVIVPDITNSHFARLVLEIENYLFAHSYSTVICNTNESDKLEKKHIDTLISQRVSGIIFISGKRHYSLDNIAVVYVDRRPDDYEKNSECAVVESDNEKGGYLAAMKLIEKGCKDIAILYSYDTDYNHKMRYNGYKKALAEHNLTEHPINVDYVSAGVATERIKDYINAGNKTDGLVCTTDILAIGAIVGLEELGVSVPGQIKVTGYDDSVLASLYNPTITSIHQSLGDMAKKSVDMILDMIDEEAKVNELHILPVRLIERATTK